MDQKQIQIVKQLFYGPALARAGSSLQSAWQTLDEAELSDWIYRCGQSGDLPIYRLAESTPDLELDGLPRTSGSTVYPQLFRIISSGLWHARISIPDGISLDAPSGRSLSALREAALASDGREPVPADRPSSEIVLSVLGSRLPEHKLPVLGPGGNISVFSVGGALEIDMVIRKRTAVLPSHWRPVDEVAATIRRRLAAIGDGLPVSGLRAAFGFFELSKYERQSIMRPAFVVAANVRDASNTQILWSSVIVEAATEASEVSLVMGLREWAA